MPGDRDINAEWFFWLAAVFALAATDPTAPPAFDLCVLKWLGFSGCPGCGLGHGIAFILDGKLMSGIDAHPLAPFGAAMICTRIVARWPAALRWSVTRKPTLCTAKLHTR